MNNLPNPISFETAQEKFINYLRSQKRSSATVTAYNGDLHQLKTYLNEHRITQATTVTTEHLQDFLDNLVTKNYTPKSISRKINSLKTFFKFLQAENLTPSNPATPLIHPKYETAPPKVLTTEEYKRLRDACRLDIRMCAIIELLLQTGIRISELANLHLEDVKKNELVVRTQENNPQRVIPLNKSAAASINNYLAIRPKVEDGHLFITKTGRPLLVRNIRTAIDRYFRQAGIAGGKVNDLRHTFISHQLQAGVEPTFLAKIVGHKRLSSTEKYLDFIKTSDQTSSKLVEL
jgi:site-specific recombinase XerD